MLVNVEKPSLDIKKPVFILGALGISAAAGTLGVLIWRKRRKIIDKSQTLKIKLSRKNISQAEATETQDPTAFLDTIPEGILYEMYHLRCIRPFAPASTSSDSLRQTVTRQLTNKELARENITETLRKYLKSDLQSGRDISNLLNAAQSRFVET